MLAKKPDKFRLTALLLSLILGLPTAVLALSLSSPTAAIITVCPAGPPACDFAAIQPALDAAAAGDTVQVAPGAYHGALTLKSDVALLSEGGPDVTIITADSGPLLAATAVFSATVDGFHFDGQNSVALGILLINSDVTLSNSWITSISGADGTEEMPDGETAVAIRIDGGSTVTLTQTIVDTVTGGDGLDGAGAIGGEAVGIWVDGAAQVAVVDSAIRELSGGAAGTGLSAPPYDCAGAGGSVAGLRAYDIDRLTLARTSLTALTGGAPCLAPARSCSARPGTVVGVDVYGGTAVLEDNLLSDFVARAGQEADTHFGIRLEAGPSALVTGNRIGPLTVEITPEEAGSTPMSSPSCPFLAGIVKGVSAQRVADLTLSGNVVHNLTQPEPGDEGQLVGLAVQDAHMVTLHSNTVLSLQGGNDGLNEIGVDIAHVQNALITANAIGDLQGGGGGSFDPYIGGGREGGSVAGLRLTAVAYASLTNNHLWALIGGRGRSQVPPIIPGLSGGDATGILVEDSTTAVKHTSAYAVEPGPGGSPGGPDGSAAGLRLLDGAVLTAFNNALIRQGVAISATQGATATLDYNAFWDNDANYAGVTPGAHDAELNPAFVAPDDGDLHLSVGSPLIDAGLDLGLFVDFEGQPRPIDGNGDRRIAPDIGADEYWPGLAGSSLAVDQLIAAPGDRLAYTITLRSGLTHIYLPAVTLTNTLPVPTTFVTGTLSVSSGTAVVAGDQLIWTGALPATAVVTISYQVAIDPTLAGPTALVNQALLDDGVEPPWALQAISLVNPIQHHFPIISVAPQ